MLLDLHDTSTRLIADAAAIHVPTLMLGAGKDWVVGLDAQRQFFEGLSSPIKQMQVFPRFFHAVFHERDRFLPVATAREFIRERFAQPVATASLLESDSHGHTRAEHNRLRAPGGRRYVPVKWALKSVGRRDGIRLGWRTGFDSGLSLDYVYENLARGITPVGRLMIEPTWPVSGGGASGNGGSISSGRFATRLAGWGRMGGRFTCSTSRRVPDATFWTPCGRPLRESRRCCAMPAWKTSRQAGDLRSPWG